MVQLSKFNNTYNQLNASSRFIGQLESTADLVSISVNVHCSEACRINIKQYRASDLTTQVQDNAEDVAADTKQVVQTPIKAAFYQVEVVNLSAVDMSFTRVTTYLQSTHYVHLDIRKLSQETDNVVMYGVDDVGSKLPIHVDGSGNIVTTGGGGAATDVNIVSALPDGLNTIGGVYCLGRNALNQFINLSIDPTDNLLVSDTTSQSYLQNIDVTNSFIREDTTNIVTYTSEISNYTNYINNKITTCDTANVNISSGSIDVYGRQSNFNFFPTPENNTINIYADETKGTNVTGGLSFTNTGTPSKINWYIYAASNPLGNPTNAGQSVASASSVYAVVNQASTGQYPFVIIYTRADSGTNAGPFKSRLVFQNTTTATTGMKLLYTGSDPTDIHTEITGANRINLPFVLGASTKSLAAAAGEEILSASLQTDSGALAGVYNFVMQQFGVQWVDTPFILPIQAGKVMVNTGVITSVESSPTGAVTNSLGNTGVVVTGVSSTLQSLTLANVGGTIFGYVKLYNKATAPTAADTPVMTLPLNHDTVQQVECHSLAFPLGIGLRATLGFPASNTTAPDGTCYATAFYTNVIN